jgi:hypothetical protein
MTTAAFCLGSDGSILVSTNLDATVPIDVCGNPAHASGGVGGGFQFNYHAGNVTFVAPAAVDGKTFVYGYVILPTGPEQVKSNQLTITLPAGYAPNGSLLEAFYA